MDNVKFYRKLRLLRLKQNRIDTRKAVVMDCLKYVLEHRKYEAGKIETAPDIAIKMAEKVFDYLEKDLP